MENILAVKKVASSRIGSGNICVVTTTLHQSVIKVDGS